MVIKGQILHFSFSSVVNQDKIKRKKSTKFAALYGKKKDASVPKIRSVATKDEESEKQFTLEGNPRRVMEKQ